MRSLSFVSFLPVAFAAGALALPTLAALPAANAQIVYDNGNPDSVAGLSSDPGAAQFEADTFTLTGAATFNTVVWFGAYTFSNTPLTDNFSIAFFATTGGIPNASALPGLTFTVGNTVNRTLSGGSTFGSSNYSYSSSLGTNVNLAAGTYGISIVNDTTNDTDDSWIWLTSNQNGSHYFRTTSNGAFILSTNSPTDFAFRLVNDVTGAAAPEPGSLVLLLSVMGAAGMVLRGQRQRLRRR